MTEQRGRGGGPQAAQLLMAAGVFTIINNFLPGSGHLDLGVLYTTGVLAVALGAAGLVIPWRRLPTRAPLALAVVALALISASDAYGGVSPYSYAVYFVVIFVWVGIAQPPRTSLWLTPVATAAYLAPVVLLHHPAPELASSASVAIPVCVLVGEVVARATGQHERASRDLQQRVRVVERLATLTARISGDLDAEAVSQALVDCAAAIIGGRAVFGRVEGDDLRVVARAGLDPAAWVDRVPLALTSVPDAWADPGLVVVTDDRGRTTMPLPPGGSALTVACRSGHELIGGLTVVVDCPADRVSDETRDLLRLIGAQGEAALLNAAKHAALLDERRHEQAVFDVLVDGVIVLDPSGRVQSCNDAAAGLLEAGTDTLLGSSLPVPVEVGETLETKMPDGRCIETRAVRLTGTAETVIALRDVSRQRALDEAKDLFLATASHELRTPLTGIKGYIATLQRHWSRLDDTERRRALAVVDEQTDALIRLTDHLLLGARAATNPSPKRVFDIGSVVRATATAYAEISERHPIRAVISPGLPPAWGDPDAVRSVLAQLIENAVKYSPAGGEVCLRAGTDGDRLVVAVEDRGIGLPADGHVDLFAPFVQGGAVNTRSVGGVGLGLYIVRRLVAEQGGQIVAEPHEGGGSTFRFWLPTTAGEAAAGSTAAAVTQLAG